MTGGKANLYDCPRCGNACIPVPGDKDGPPGWECLICGALWPTSGARVRELTP